MKNLKNKLSILFLSTKIMMVKFQIFIIKQLIKLENEIKAFQNDIRTDNMKT